MNQPNNFTETVATVVMNAASDAQLGSNVPCLVVMYGNNLGKRHSLDTEEQIIGRSDAVHIQIDQESVSRQHAKIITQNGNSHIVDLQSTNGTFINDKRVKEIELHDGNLVRTGQTIFKYLSGSNIENKYHEEIYRLTTIDGLTGAYNKRFFLEAMARELNRAIRYERFLSLAMFDLDHFKKINDRYGHLAGDYVLRELASIIQKNIRRVDIFARYGGEEFVLILPEIDKGSALLVGEKLREDIETHTFNYNDQKIHVTISMGIRTLESSEKEVKPDDFINDADDKLYSAKTNGRNNVSA